MIMIYFTKVQVCLLLYPLSLQCFTTTIAHHPQMIRKVEERTYRISKDCPPFIILIFYQEGQEFLRLKAINHPQQLTASLQQQQKFCYLKDFVYNEMPDLIRNNFANLGEIFEQIQLTSRSNFKFDPQVGLRIGLQVGTKVRYCLFQLQLAEHTYLETLEMLLWQAEVEAERQRTPEQLYIHELRMLRGANERQSHQILQLQLQLNAEREEKQKYQQQTGNLTAELYELRVMKEARESQIESEEPNRNCAEQSSMICEEQRVPVQIINLEEDSGWLPAIEKHNAIQGISRFRFRLDINAGSDPSHSFELSRQRLTYRRRDEKHRQFTSLLPLMQPLGIVSFRLLKTREYNIYVGVVLYERVKMQATTRDGEAISYKLSGGGLWEDKVRAQVTTDKINPNEILTLLINGRRRSIQWWKGSKMMTERVLPQSFQMREAHPFVNMIHEGDCVEFL